MFRRTETSLPGVCILTPDCHRDARGYFMETYSRKAFEAVGITADFVQDNQSFTAARGTLRGVHFQQEPAAQAKLVRANRGHVLVAAVDLRKGSPTYLQSVMVELSGESQEMVFIPRGFGHGFLTLSDDVEYLYKVDNDYSPKDDRSIRFDDPALGLNWPITDPIISEKDRKAPLLKDSDCNFVY